MRLSNERLTTGPSSATGEPDRKGIAGTHSTESVRGHENRQAEICEVVQRLVHTYQRPEPRVMTFLRPPESRCDDTLAAIDRVVNDKIDHGHEPAPGRGDQDECHRDREVHAAMGEQWKKPAGSL